ncbi:hypothetical protein F4553_000253 [Allocatelliglobosispora scoriae]|uniref:Uncharacterized protein n=1 Tax=Allocatelliglobosispora scoriae TaxID=643052 RepID=A0A841BEZ7_9ACTN|nr:hypothetical protein [Allocatelliglobosispora scoriae]MBB5866874.1 hypothetical protein [Allocatelliglobosispora scoriae]
MRFWKKTIITLAASTALLLGLASSAHAYPGPADDRVKSVATSWWTYDNVDSAWTTNFLVSNNARITDLRVVTSSPLRFRWTAVRNTGAYATGSWWYPSVTMAQVNTLLTQNSARLITAVKHSSTLYAVVMVSNTGANAKTWGWCDTDFAGVGACLGSTNRLTNIVSYAQNRFVVIFVRNDEGYGWCWYAGITRSQINTLCSGQSVLDISTNPDNTFNVVKVAYDNDGRPMDFSTLGALVTYAVTTPQDRPLLAVPYNTGGTVRWITSLRHN